MTDSGWLLTGEVYVKESSMNFALQYRIECDDQWRTRAALVEGDAGQPFRFELSADGEGNWTVNGIEAHYVEGALDVDLGFTPMTNTLPIRRLQLDVGARAPVRSAWLRFPELRFEALQQTYFREAELRFRYEAIVDGEPFKAMLDTDGCGRVIRYEGLWEAEFSENRM